MHSVGLPMLAAVALLAVGACQSGSAPNRAGTMAFVPPNQTFAQGLGITGGPISSEQAKQIAAAAAGGTALTVEQEDEDGVQVFGVKVQTATGNKDVKVRISDGAVTKIESDDDAAETLGTAPGNQDVEARLDDPTSPLRVQFNLTALQRGGGDDDGEGEGDAGEGGGGGGGGGQGPGDGGGDHDGDGDDGEDDDDGGDDDRGDDDD